MDYKKSNAPTNTITRDINNLCENTGNIYETVAIISKRANQISVDLKEEEKHTLEQYAGNTPDNLEEVFENREQIDISKYYERLPKPTLLATQEYIEDKTYFRNPAKSK